MAEIENQKWFHKKVRKDPRLATVGIITNRYLFGDKAAFPYTKQVLR